MPNSSTHAFLICGYGVPKTIEDDLNYGIYLRTALNRIVGVLQKHPHSNAIVVVSGGLTDMFKPYKRTEAGEMKAFLQTLVRRPALKSVRPRITLLTETKALSTVENVLFFKEMLHRRHLRPTSMTIMCEWTREKKVKIFSKRILGKGVSVSPIDFDQSANRYLDPAFIEKKESADIHRSLKALSSPQLLKKYHQLLVKKVLTLREAGPENHVRAVKLWDEQAMRELEEKMV